MSDARIALRNLPLPEPHLVLLGVGIVLQAIRPLRLPVRGPLAAFGAGGTIGAAAAAIGWATRAAGTVDMAAADRLITGGPYALTRHPMYEAWTAAFASLAILLRNGWLALLLPVLLALVHRDTGREDRRLRERFGAPHAEYARTVPRYVTIRFAQALRRRTSHSWRALSESGRLESDT